MKSGGETKSIADIHREYCELLKPSPERVCRQSYSDADPCTESTGDAQKDCYQDYGELIQKAVVDHNGKESRAYKRFESTYRTELTEIRNRAAQSVSNTGHQGYDNVYSAVEPVARIKLEDLKLVCDAARDKQTQCMTVLNDQMASLYQANSSNAQALTAVVVTQFDNIKREIDNVAGIINTAPGTPADKTLQWINGFCKSNIVVDSGNSACKADMKGLLQALRAEAAHDQRVIDEILAHPERKTLPGWRIVEIKFYKTERRDISPGSEVTEEKMVHKVELAIAPGEQTKFITIRTKDGEEKPVEVPISYNETKFAGLNADYQEVVNPEKGHRDVNFTFARKETVDGTEPVEERTRVIRDMFKIGDKRYKSLQEAMEAALIEYGVEEWSLRIGTAIGSKRVFTEGDATGASDDLNGLPILEAAIRDNFRITSESFWSWGFDLSVARIALKGGNVEDKESRPWDIRFGPAIEYNHMSTPHWGWFIGGALLLSKATAEYAHSSDETQMQNFLKILAQATLGGRLRINRGNAIVAGLGLTAGTTFGPKALEESAPPGVDIRKSWYTAGPDVKVFIGIEF